MMREADAGKIKIQPQKRHELSQTGLRREDQQKLFVIIINIMEVILRAKVFVFFPCSIIQYFFANCSFLTSKCN